MSALNIPNLTLADGTEIPQLGLGVSLVDPGGTERNVTAAPEAG